MSEMINNREQRQKVLKELIKELHAGKTVEEVKPRFEKLIQGISVQEITEMEQALILEGVTVEEIQNLCDVHAAVFKGSIEDIHRPETPEQEQGHPVHIFKLENRQLEKVIAEEIRPALEKFMESGSDSDQQALAAAFGRLREVDKHYGRKENLLFPYLEKYGITAPPKVMWGVDDEIRAAIKEVLGLLSGEVSDRDTFKEKAEAAVTKLTEMIYKEENILFPMSLDTLTAGEWGEIAEASPEYGYTLIQPPGQWAPAQKQETTAEQQPAASRGEVEFDAGSLSPEEINAMLNTLPLDITFVDKHDTVRYFTQGKERIFARPKTVLGRQVSNCHPPASVHIVEKIVDDFKSGTKDHEDFWIMLGDKYVYIRYFAVRNAKGEYLGTVEVTQDIKPIQQVEGEKRLMSE